MYIYINKYIYICTYAHLSIHDICVEVMWIISLFKLMVGALILLEYQLPCVKCWPNPLESLPGKILSLESASAIPWQPICWKPGWWHVHRAVFSFGIGRIYASRQLVSRKPSSRKALSPAPFQPSETVLPQLGYSHLLQQGLCSRRRVFWPSTSCKIPANSFQWQAQGFLKAVFDGLNVWCVLRWSFVLYRCWFGEWGGPRWRGALTTFCLRAVGFYTALKCSGNCNMLLMLRT